MKYKRGDLIRYDLEPHSYWSDLGYDQDRGVILELKDEQALVRWAIQRDQEEMVTRMYIGDFCLVG
jgi:hypothetical protein